MSCWKKNVTFEILSHQIRLNTSIPDYLTIYKRVIYNQPIKKQEKKINAFVMSDGLWINQPKVSGGKKGKKAIFLLRVPKFN